MCLQVTIAFLLFEYNVELHIEVQTMIHFYQKHFVQNYFVDYSKSLQSEVPTLCPCAPTCP